MELEQKYKVLKCFSELKSAMTKFNLQWEFTPSVSFNNIVNKIKKEYKDNKKEIYHITKSEVNPNTLKNLKNNEILDFGCETTLEKIEDENKYTYLYKNKKAVIFGLHMHIYNTETIVPIEHDITMYLVKNNNIEQIEVKVGQEFTVPSKVQHATLFSKPNTIKITWK